MSFLKLVQYVLTNAFRYFTSNIKLGFVATSMVASAFVVIGGQNLFFYNLRLNLFSSMDEQNMHVYFKHELHADEIQNFQNEYCQTEWIKRCDYVDEKKAKEKFFKNNSDLVHVFESLQNNPLPASIEVVLHGQRLDHERVSAWSKRLKSLSFVDWVDDGQEWVWRWTSFIKLFDWTSRIMILMIGLLSLFIVSSAIGFFIFTHKDEIEILQLVGATKMVTLLPFIATGVLLACLGVLLSFVVLKIMVLVINAYFWPQWIEIMPRPIQFLMVKDMVLNFCFALLIGAMGAWGEGKRYLDSK